MTNGDKLRGMDDDELGKALSDIWFDEWSHGGFCAQPRECPEPWDSCVSCIVAWLKKEGE
jgi:hypothetical protein